MRIPHEPSAIAHLREPTPDDPWRRGHDSLRQAEASRPSDPHGHERCLRDAGDLGWCSIPRTVLTGWGLELLLRTFSAPEALDHHETLWYRNCFELD
ncbi:MAG: hypothetical protein ACI9ON_001572 [Limisphaerales bacterium]|jgi:hypothetical protein